MKLKKETLVLQNQIMHKVKVVESLSVDGKLDKKRVKELHLLWAEILKRNNTLTLQYKAQQIETESWMRIAAENIKLSFGLYLPQPYNSNLCGSLK